MPAVFHDTRAPVAALPIEMLAEIVEYLAPAERWRAASLSRDFRAAARLAGFSIHYRLKWFLGNPIQDALVELSGLISRIGRDDLRISLDFACCPANVPGAWEKSLDIFLDIIAVASDAMPYMTSFAAVIPEQFLAVFDEKLLCLPAPNLQSLSLTQSFTADFWNPNIHSITGSLFAGDTPTLREVSLFYIPLPADPIRVFARVRTLRIVCSDGLPPTDLARHFPALKTLHTELYSDTYGPSVHRVERAFARLSLDELALDCARTVSCDPEIARVLGIRHTRVVRLQGRSIFWQESLLAMPSSGSLSARLAPVQRGAEITVIPDHHGKWRRVFGYDGSRQDTSFSTVAQCPSFRDAVTYVRLDCSLIGDFLDAACDLPVLRELRIDMCSPGAYRRIATLLPAHPPIEPDFSGDPHYYVPCAALHTLTLFALDGPAAIDALEAAQLGRALGQAARRKDARACAVLIGVVFSNDSEYAELVDQAFSGVQLGPFAGRDSVEDRRCVMWGL